MKPGTSISGRLGEDIASKFLVQKGYKIITRNFKSRFGEIDLIAIKANVLVFVEVKTRWSDKFGSPVEAVTPWKILKIRKTAEYYTMLNPNLPERQRIEVVAIEVEDDIVTSIKIIEAD